MPLRRKDIAFVPEFDKYIGVSFTLIDVKTNEPVDCRVTYAALCDRANFDGNGDDWMKAYSVHQSKIELLASGNYDNGKRRIYGRVIVDTDELTPRS